MGVKNRQRRAAKQKRRARQGHGPRPGRDEPSLAEILWAAVDIMLDGDSEASREVLAVLDTLPGLETVVEQALAQQRARMGQHGWTDHDLAEVEARRLNAPAGASARERAVRLLALLVSMPPLPTVTTRTPRAAGDEAMLAKIRALLAKAESTTFPEEAEALSAKAQELMARHRIDHVLVGDGDDAGTEPVGRRIWLDDPYADAKATLLAEVAAANQCRAVLLAGLGCSHVVGFPTDLDVVELLHTSLLVQATAAMAAAGPQRDRRGRSRTRSFRQSFLVAYAHRIGDRLAEVTQGAATDAAADAPSLLPALVAREGRVEDAIARALPGAVRRSTSVTNPAGWAAGTLAADAADLSAGPRLS